ncbi:asparagine synthase C-terminal domain-containing protein [Halobellus limi]|uniref:Asparagine synthase (Glutamine-hydrolysing) n=1 Tax=Halobellus limi TaxID=699433 RepID=A0A1H5YPG5_9EURY|nr:asparagine synthase-related protein [Halobellus limi]QCC48390.1 asparagine synthetase B [Halobellus limi]SEG25572.1 asparagine synthase (glutamine-hydrolysing) [Halobellus limi]
MARDGGPSDRETGDEVGSETKTGGAGPATEVDGVDPATVRNAIETGEPLPGTAGFAGVVDGRLVRDVLGRRPLFVEADAPSSWAFDPRALSDPVAVPAGAVTPPATAVTATDDAERTWTLPDPRPNDDDREALRAVRDAVLDRTRAAALGNDQTVDSDDVAVAFSGGVDSAVVAAGIPNAPCYVAGFEGCHDVAAARDAAEAMDRDLRVVELTHDDVRETVPELVASIGRTNPMDLSIALPLYLVGERAAADGFDRLALGQGADELFGGYAKVEKAPTDPRVDADTVRGARRETLATIPGQAERDVVALRAAGVEPLTPLLHDEVVAAALELPEHLLVDDGRRKVALREAARDVVPESVRTADKKAVQYGTYVSRELDRLARRAGFKRRMDDHVERYVRELVGDGPVRPPDDETGGSGSGD